MARGKQIKPGDVFGGRNLKGEYIPLPKESKWNGFEITNLNSCMQSSIFVKERMLVEKVHVRIPSYGPEQKITFFCAHS
jgi:hypothetical protein